MTYRIYMKGDRKLDISKKEYKAVASVLGSGKYVKFVEIQGQFINTDEIKYIKEYNPPKNYSV